MNHLAQTALPLLLRHFSIDQPAWVGPTHALDRVLWSSVDKAIRHQEESPVWEDISSQLTLPAGVRHATVLRVPKAMVQRLRAAFGTRDRGAWRPEGVLA